MENLLIKYLSKKKSLINYRIVQRFNCGHTRATKHANSATIYNWDIHEADDIVHYALPTSQNIHACDLIDVYQERKSIKRYYIIKGESLPITQTP
jgi:hypothetical protein